MKQLIQSQTSIPRLSSPRKSHEDEQQNRWTSQHWPDLDPHRWMFRTCQLYKWDQEADLRLDLLLLSFGGKLWRQSSRPDVTLHFVPRTTSTGTRLQPCRCSKNLIQRFYPPESVCSAGGKVPVCFEIFLHWCQGPSTNQADDEDTWCKDLRHWLGTNFPPLQKWTSKPICRFLPLL